MHIWMVELSEAGVGLTSPPDPVRLDECVALLDAEERARMDRYRFEIHRHRFALRHAALRTILSDYLRCEARDVVFEYSSHGKPELAQSADIAGQALRFNLSDSEDLALIGVTMNAALGVDVERIRTVAERDAIAQSHFSAREREQYADTPSELRDRAFFNCWTRKEAWLKARGEGLIGDLGAFDVSLGVTARLEGVRGDDDATRRWRLYSRSIPPDFVAAVAVERMQNTLSWKRFRWSRAAARSYRLREEL